MGVTKALAKNRLLHSLSTGGQAVPFLLRDTLSLLQVLTCHKGLGAQKALK